MAVEMFTNLNVVNNKFPCLKRFIFVKNYKLKTMISKQTPKGGKCVRWDLFLCLLVIFVFFGIFAFTASIEIKKWAEF